MAQKFTRTPSMRERVQDTLSTHRNDLVSLLSRYVAQGKCLLQPHHLIDGLEKVIGEDKGKHLLSDGPFSEILRSAQEAIVVPPFVAIAIRPRPGVWEYVRVNVYELNVEQLTESEYLHFKEELVDRKGDDHFVLELDFEPFNESVPRPTRSSSIGNGVQFLNRHLSSIMFRNKDCLEPLLNFLRVHRHKGMVMMVNDRIQTISRLQSALSKAEDYITKIAPDTPYSEFEFVLQGLGFERGWGDTAKRVLEMMHLLLDILQAPDPSTLETFLGRIPMVFNVVILSVHGYFGQANVLGLPDTGGQIVYILDQVRALEREMLSRIKQQGLDTTPRILIVTRLIPDAKGTTCNQRLEKVSGTEHTHILRVPFRSEKGVLHKWISRFDVWPYLETFTEDAASEIIGELQGTPDLIIGNYSDGNLVSSLLSHKMGVTQVAQNTCWSCGHRCKSNQELLNHLHEPSVSEGLKLLWEDDKYLQPYLEGDPLLFSFDQDEDLEDDECMPSIDEEELAQVFKDAHVAGLDDEMAVDSRAASPFVSSSGERQKIASTSNVCGPGFSSPTRAMADGVDGELGLSDIKKKDPSLRVSFANVAASEIKKVNEGYFGSYSSFGIHREMLGDKIRTDAYEQAITRNPTLLNGAAVLDVGCGTGILSLFAATAGATQVIAVDASERMAAVATKIAKDNGLLRGENTIRGNEQSAGVIEVVHGMIEDLDKSISIEPHSIDVLVSEWMGYCLLYETMLSSVLYARDRWLKPGGAILPDTATMFAAGFGKGCTSLPFWENVYGFNMSSVGNELVKDAAEFPIVDVVDSNNLVTETAVLKNFDLATMTAEMMDFTSSIELLPKSGETTQSTWCYGVVLWFDTGFTSRFCKEMPANLSTSPYIPKTHWAQTILTFKEPVLLSLETSHAESSALVGTASCPASRIQLRISIVRAPEHRAIDISVETCGVAHDGRKRAWPVQIFNLA